MMRLIKWLSRSVTAFTLCFCLGSADHFGSPKICKVHRNCPAKHYCAQPNSKSPSNAKGSCQPCSNCTTTSARCPLKRCSASGQKTPFSGTVQDIPPCPAVTWPDLVPSWTWHSFTSNPFPKGAACDCPVGFLCKGCVKNDNCTIRVHDNGKCLRSFSAFCSDCNCTLEKTGAKHSGAQRLGNLGVIDFRRHVMCQESRVTPLQNKTNESFTFVFSSGHCGTTMLSEYSTWETLYRRKGPTNGSKQMPKMPTMAISGELEHNKADLIDIPGSIRKSQISHSYT